MCTTGGVAGRLARVVEKFGHYDVDLSLSGTGVKTKLKYVGGGWKLELSVTTTWPGRLYKHLRWESTLKPRDIRQPTWSGETRSRATLCDVIGCRSRQKTLSVPNPWSHVSP